MPLRVGKVEALFDPLKPDRHPIDPLRKLSHLHMYMGDFALKSANALLYFANIIAHVVDRATDVAQVLQNDVIHLSHRIKLSRYRIIVNRGHDVLPEDQRENRSGPAVAPARPALLR
jgi:hypothetical protein